MIKEKIEQAVEILREKKIDMWLTFVRESATMPDPAIDMVVGGHSTWQTAWIITRSGETIAIAGREGLDLGEIQMGSRTKPDGSVLRWKMTNPTKDREEGAVPYFIDWGDAPHPAVSAPAGCVLQKLNVFHPEAERVTYLLLKLGINQKVEKGPVALEATILSPKGRIILR